MVNAGDAAALYREWEGRLGMALSDAERALPVAEYAKLCQFLVDVCGAELDLIADRLLAERAAATDRPGGVPDTEGSSDGGGN